jgi:hypothetical protein
VRGLTTVIPSTPGIFHDRPDNLDNSPTRLYVTIPRSENTAVDAISLVGSGMEMYIILRWSVIASVLLELRHLCLTAYSILCCQQLQSAINNWHLAINNRQSAISHPFGPTYPVSITTWYTISSNRHTSRWSRWLRLTGLLTLLQSVTSRLIGLLHYSLTDYRQVLTWPWVRLQCPNASPESVKPSHQSSTIQSAQVRDWYSSEKCSLNLPGLAVDWSPTI